MTGTLTALPRRQTVLVVDDTPDNLAVLGEMLEPFYRVLIALDGPQAIQVASGDPCPDLILLDVMMPGMDGYQVLAKLRAQSATRHIPVIFVTAMNSHADEERGLELGAVDYITKPLRPRTVLARVHTQLSLKRAKDLLENENAWLEAEVERRMRENQLVQEISIQALARLAEIRDPETGDHILRTKCFVEALATRLVDHPRFRAVLTPDYIELLTRSAPLHDIGKVGIPDHILLKPGRLTADEWEVMKTHTLLGASAIAQAEREVDTPVAFLGLAREIARWHHEKWDGSGYPDGLAGDAIPVSARLMALADVFDALICRRVYKPPMPFEQARTIIREGRGVHFDPDVVDAFEAIFDDFCTIATRYRESEQGHAP